MDNKKDTNPADVNPAGDANLNASETMDQETKAALLKEIQELRLKNSTYKELYEGSLKKDEPKEEPKKEEPQDDVTKKVNEVLEQKEMERAKANKQAALELFVKERSEFNPENDPGGIKLAALKQKMSRFNDQGLYEINEFQNLITDAHRLLVGTDKPSEAVKVNPYSNANPGQDAPANKNNENKNISEDDKKLLDRGISPERLEKLKKKMPDFLDTLVAQIRN